jgi:hypothetical protein
MLNASRRLLLSSVTLPSGEAGERRGEGDQRAHEPECRACADEQPGALEPAQRGVVEVRERLGEPVLAALAARPRRHERERRRHRVAPRDLPENALGARDVAALERGAGAERRLLETTGVAAPPAHELRRKRAGLDEHEGEGGEHQDEDRHAQRLGEVEDELLDAHGCLR